MCTRRLARQLHDRIHDVAVVGLERLHGLRARDASLRAHDFNVLRFEAGLILFIENDLRLGDEVCGAAGRQICSAGSDGVGGSHGALDLRCL